MRYAWVFLALTACHRAELHPTAGIRLDPSSLPLPPATVGAQTSAQLTVENLGRTAISVELAVDAPFTVEPTHLDLAGGGTQKMTVRFAPVRPGSASGQLRATAASGVAFASLTGEGGCTQTDPCRTSTFDGQRCVSSPGPDGTACEEVCLKNAHCSGGACVGDPVSCDDGNACTVDSCAAGNGCLHTACEQVEVPCQVGSCDGSGCRLDPAPDGASCGVADCVDAPICLQGKCTLAVVSEGSACDSPCGAGQCHAQRCQPGTALSPLWSVDVPTGFEIISSLSLDAAGNVYWLEYRFGSDATKQLASASPDGQLRFRVGSGSSTITWLEPVVDDVNGVVLLDDGKDTLRAVKQTDGSQAWTSPLRALIANPNIPADDDLVVLGLAGGQGYVVAYVAVYLASGGSPQQNWLLGIDTKTGAPVWKQQWADILFGGAMDEAGNFYLRATVAGLMSIVSIDPAGNTRWSIPDPNPMGFQSVDAVSRGRLYLGHGEVLDAATGALLSSPPFDPTIDGQQYGDLRYVIGQWNIGPAKAWLSVGDYGDTRQIDTASGAIDWRGPEFYEQTALALTTLDTGLVGDVEVTGDQVSLAEVSPRGHEAWRCAVPVTLESQPRGIAVRGGRVYYAWTPYHYDQAYPGVMAFAVPGRELATGWPIGQAGGAGLGRQER